MKDNKIVKQIPKSEDGPRVKYTINNNVYLLTWDKIKNKHTLWMIHKNGFEKLTTKNSPLELYNVIDRLENNNEKQNR